MWEREGGEPGKPQPTQLRKLCDFSGKTAHDSGNNTWAKTLQNNAAGVISKTRNVSSQLLFQNFFYYVSDFSELLIEVIEYASFECD